jgi:hypothetical protein
MNKEMLFQQGYCNIEVNKLSSINNGLRFTPAVCMIGAMIALYLQNPMMHFALGALGIISFWFPNRHPFDILYNKVIRHIENSINSESFNILWEYHEGDEDMEEAGEGFQEMVDLKIELKSYA